MGLNKNPDSDRLAFLIASMQFTVAALGQQLIEPPFAASRLKFDLDQAQQLIGSTLTTQSLLTILGAPEVRGEKP